MYIGAKQICTVVKMKKSIVTFNNVDRKAILDVSPEEPSQYTQLPRSNDVEEEDGDDKKPFDSAASTYFVDKVPVPDADNVRDYTILYSVFNNHGVYTCIKP